MPPRFDSTQFAIYVAEASCDDGMWSDRHAGAKWHEGDERVESGATDLDWQIGIGKQHNQQMRTGK